MATPVPAAATYEEEHVHNVYESIAGHFSATRYKPWPVVGDFLHSLPKGAIGIDVGCGNGKYLAVNPHIYIMGSDRSPSLVRIARDHGGERMSDVAVADGLSLPYPDRAVDFAICIAVVHHLSTEERRIAAVKALLDCVKDDGKVLVFVWALEQGSSRRGFDEGTDQDLLVPWVKKAKTEKGGQPVAGASDKTYQRYYHLFRKGELEDNVVSAGGKVLDHGYDRDNWWVIASRA